MRIPEAAASIRPEARALGELVPPRVHGDYEIFFATTEGIKLPSGGQETSGYVLDATGHVYWFYLGWDPERAAPALTEWEQVPPEKDWARTREYREARRKLGLPTPERAETDSAPTARV